MVVELTGKERVYFQVQDMVKDMFLVYKRRKVQDLDTLP